MVDGEIVRTYYRCIDGNGNLWIETRDPEELAEHAEFAVKPVTFYRMDVIEYTEGWKLFDMVEEMTEKEA